MNFINRLFSNIPEEEPQVNIEPITEFDQRKAAFYRQIKDLKIEIGQKNEEGPVVDQQEPELFEEDIHVSIVRNFEKYAAP